jgi:uncharacterized protein with NRDE domain
VACVCLLVVAFGVVPDTALLIGANRDELLARPTTLMTALGQAGPRVLGGRDEESGGTWLAVNEHGVFAALTNQPLGDAKDPNKRSRGELPLVLASEATARDAVDVLLERFEPADYNGCWLLVGDRDALFFIDFTGLVPLEAIALAPGIHVLENKPLGAPSSKVARVDALLDGLAGDLAEATLTLEKALADHWVPKTAEVAGEMAEGTAQRPRLVPNCVHLSEYGTRSSCLVRVGAARDAPPELRVADGPPCTAPFVDVSGWWHADLS